MYSKPKHKSSAQKRKDKREQGDVTAKLTKLDRSFCHTSSSKSSANVSNVDVQRQPEPEANDSSPASPPSLPSSSTSEAVSVAVAVQPSSPASQEERLDLAVPGGGPPVPPRAPTDRGLYGAIETPDAKIKSYIIATGLCRPTGPFPRDKHQGNRFNPLLSSLCRCQAVVV